MTAAIFGVQPLATAGNVVNDRLFCLCACNTSFWFVAWPGIYTS